MSDNLTVKDLYSLEEYSERRAAFRESVMKHKRQANCIGSISPFYFESKMTIEYQVQEMPLNREDF